MNAQDGKTLQEGVGGGGGAEQQTHLSHYQQAYFSSLTQFKVFTPYQEQGSSMLSY